jgi:proton-dependent oligopeptide transporter, POT family
MNFSILSVEIINTPMADTVLQNKPASREGQHPAALYILFFTEMWERFGYYLMVGIFFLYLIDPTANGGKGFDNTSASDLVGSFIALVYLTPFIGGMLADRYFGYRRSIIFGAVLMSLGYFGLGLQGNLAMYLSLLLIIVGNGFFKPNISTLLGNIYNENSLKPKKDTAYMIFYMGINIGAFFCNFVAAIMRHAYGWPAAFASAGVGMIIGIIIFIASTRNKHIAEADVKKPMQKEDMSLSKIFGYVYLPAIITGIIGWNIAGWTGSSPFHTNSNNAFMFACVPIIIFYIGLYFRGTKEDRKGLGALLAFFAVSIVFWVIYNQNSTALTIWANTYTNRHVSEAAVPYAKPFGLQSVTSDSVNISKIDNHFKAVLDANGNTIQTKGIDPYLQNLPKAQWPAHGQQMKLFSPELFQSVNPFFIVAFTLLIAMLLFGWLRRMKKEPSTPMKIALGMFIAGISSLLMAFAVMSTNVYENKTSLWWLVGTYAIFTVAELFISPIGLSMVSKLSPARFTALMMGAWFLVNSIAGKVSGLMATYWDSFIDKKYYFLILFVAAVISGLVMLSMVRWLRNVVREKTGAD